MVSRSGRGGVASVSRPGPHGWATPPCRFGGSRRSPTSAGQRLRAPRDEARRRARRRTPRPGDGRKRSRTPRGSLIPDPPLMPRDIPHGSPTRADAGAPRRDMSGADRRGRTRTDTHRGNSPITLDPPISAPGRGTAPTGTRRAWVRRPEAARTRSAALSAPGGGPGPLVGALAGDPVALADLAPRRGTDRGASLRARRPRLGCDRGADRRGARSRRLMGPSIGSPDTARRPDAGDRTAFRSWTRPGRACAPPAGHGDRGGVGKMPSGAPRIGAPAGPSEPGSPAGRPADGPRRVHPGPEPVATRSSRDEHAGVPRGASGGHADPPSAATQHRSRGMPPPVFGAGPRPADPMTRSARSNGGPNE